MNKKRRRNDVSTSSPRSIGTNRINLKFTQKVDLEYFNRGILVRLVRLTALVSFRSTEGWSTGDEAIVDTGSPISVIPRSNWEDFHHYFLSSEEYPVSLAGVTTTARFGVVTLRAHDGTNVSPPMEVKAHLLSDDSHPLIVGFEDFLTIANLHSRFSMNMAYLEFPAGE